MTQQLYRGLDVKPVVVVGSVGTDSVGDALPANFDSLASAFTRNGTGSIATEARTDGIHTWTQTYTRDGSDNVTAISKWVKS